MSLLYKPPESITATDLQALIDNRIGESPYIEYKTEVFEKRDEKKKLQFLGSLSAFANAAGGDLLIGVRADSGLPIDLPGLDPAMVDSEILRILQVVATSIDPHLTVRFQTVPLPTGRSVLVIRVPQSWSAPHGIPHNGHFQFFKRHAAGRSPMTLSELRTAFTLSSSIIERTRKFCAERLATITAAEGPWGYLDKPLFVCHIVPFAGMADAINIDFSIARSYRKLSPLCAESDGFIRQGDLRYNLDGVMMRQGTAWHTQLFRNGSLEWATTEPFRDGSLKAWTSQVKLVNLLGRFCWLLQALGVAPPFTLSFAILNATNFYLCVSKGSDRTANSKHQIDRDRLLLPEVVLNDFSAEPTATLKSVFDCLWNAAGEERCAFYGSNGEWTIDPSWLDPPTAK
jgi:hypothetical protein